MKGFPTNESSSRSRGPGAAPLRMETDEQRKFGYGGDGGGSGGGEDEDDEAWDDGWRPGDGGAPSPWGLVILLCVGAWALWEYKRPGGSLNPETKKAAMRAKYLRAYKAKFGHYPGEAPKEIGSSGATGTIRGL